MEHKSYNEQIDKQIKNTQKDNVNKYKYIWYMYFGKILLNVSINFSTKQLKFWFLI